MYTTTSQNRLVCWLVSKPIFRDGKSGRYKITWWGGTSPPGSMSRNHSLGHRASLKLRCYILLHSIYHFCYIWLYPATLGEPLVLEEYIDIFPLLPASDSHIRKADVQISWCISTNKFHVKINFTHPCGLKNYDAFFLLRKDYLKLGIHKIDQFQWLLFLCLIFYLFSAECYYD